MQLLEKVCGKCAVHVVKKARISGTFATAPPSVRKKVCMPSSSHKPKTQQIGEDETTPQCGARPIVYPGRVTRRSIGEEDTKGEQFPMWESVLFALAVLLLSIIAMLGTVLVCRAPPFGFYSSKTSK